MHPQPCVAGWQNVGYILDGHVAVVEYARGKLSPLLEIADCGVGHDLGEVPARQDEVFSHVVEARRDAFREIPDKGVLELGGGINKPVLKPFRGLRFIRMIGPQAQSASQVLEKIDHGPEKPLGARFLDFVVPAPVEEGGPQEKIADKVLDVSHHGGKILPDPAEKRALFRAFSTTFFIMIVVRPGLRRSGRPVLFEIVICGGRPLGRSGRNAFDAVDCAWPLIRGGGFCYSAGFKDWAVKIWGITGASGRNPPFVLWAGLRHEVRPGLDPGEKAAPRLSAGMLQCGRLSALSNPDPISADSGPNESSGRSTWDRDSIIHTLIEEKPSKWEGFQNYKTCATHLHRTRGLAFISHH